MCVFVCTYVGMGAMPSDVVRPLRLYTSCIACTMPLMGMSIVYPTSSSKPSPFIGGVSIVRLKSSFVRRQEHNCLTKSCLPPFSFIGMNVVYLTSYIFSLMLSTMHIGSETKSFHVPCH